MIAMVLLGKEGATSCPVTGDQTPAALGSDHPYNKAQSGHDMQRTRILQ
jgi:hypothetical protein